jgi:hypothetical protein
MNLAIDPENRAIAREEMNIMKRRTLDIAFSIGGVVFSLLLVVVGLILVNQKNFATDYVSGQLKEQAISFKPADTLVSEKDFQATLLKSLGSQAAVDAFVAEKHLTSEAGSACLNKFAGQPMLTGKQAECYAQDFIRLHALESSIVSGTGLKDAQGVSLDNKSYTYATISPVITAAKAALDAATKAGAPADQITSLTKQWTGLQSLRTDTLLRAETLRGLLLTTYGFSVFGDRAGQAAWVLFIGAILIFLLSLAGFVHAFTSKKADNVILAVEHHEPKKEMAAV